jgi:hypothetical protein
LEDNYINPSNAKLNPICHLLALLGAHLIFHVSRIRVNVKSLEMQVKVKLLSSTLTCIPDGHQKKEKLYQKLY